MIKHDKTCYMHATVWRKGRQWSVDRFSTMSVEIGKRGGGGGEHGGADKHRVYQTWLFRENRSVLIQAVGEGCMLRPAG